MEVLVIIAGAIGFFALIMASIALHEVGHLVPGKIFDVRISQYFVGFGKTLWSFKRGETEYGVKAIPLGGFVRLLGMYPPARPQARPTWLTRLADTAREAEYEQITPADEGRLFHQKKTWQKLVIMAGGPLMNILLALLIFTGVNALHGQYRAQLSIASVSECIVPAGRAAQTCQPGDPATPAARAGLEVGDVVQSFNGTAVTSWAQFSDLIRANRDRRATIVVMRHGQPTTVTTNTVITGVVDRIDPSRTVEAGFLGVGPTYRLERSGPVTAARDLWQLTKQSTVALASFPQRVWNVAVDMVTGRPRDENGPISIVGASRVAGEIAAADQVPAGDRVASWFTMLGSVNLFVALLNLVPLMPLDGGHMAGAVWEWVRRLAARVARRPDPGHVDTAKLLPVAYVVGGFLALSGAVLIIADIFFPVRLF
ncbi:M50 family metallopeptidase [Aestuariimicrobium sp. T2.26MG-19.2B]|uniref:M50 family metallopeptidase n=1 Tax=Aestuariimicrobium sp. T2.26MG-19.2B TaxID=3040679 RepID=UPI002477C976|nr:site-2 protease family protein [Aestuariimicrobium sp. T2.26MG-19.2B]CAI9398926.1 Zinc metalloprotease Rip1 [Aestuariimicrobium sp. T2.26MG-19.2B]